MSRDFYYVSPVLLRDPPTDNPKEHFYATLADISWDNLAFFVTEHYRRRGNTWAQCSHPVIHVSLDKTTDDCVFCKVELDRAGSIPDAR